MNIDSYMQKLDHFNKIKPGTPDSYSSRYDISLTNTEAKTLCGHIVEDITKMLTSFCKEQKKYYRCAITISVLTCASLYTTGLSLMSVILGFGAAIYILKGRDLRHLIRISERYENIFNLLKKRLDYGNFLSYVDRQAQMLAKNPSSSRTLKDWLLYSGNYDKAPQN